MKNTFRAQNPLLAAVREYPDRASFAAAMNWDPLAEIDRQTLTFEEKIELLEGKKTPLKPTTLTLAMGYTVHGMVRSYYRRINPNLLPARRAMARCLTLKDEEVLGIDELAMGACLLVVKGPTGTSKSVSIARACSALGEQVVKHARNEAAGWNESIQLKYLIVAMSHDGSRGGLLLNILYAIDHVLKTDYAKDVPRECKTVEKMSGRVVKLLRTLFVGVLVIEEIQLKNVVLSSDARNLQLFLLSLANSGIPLVLVGNTLGFSWLADVSQDARRMAERRMFVFHPSGALGAEDDEWDTAVFPGIARFYLLDQRPEPGCRETLKILCGGDPGIGLAIWCQAQVRALFWVREKLSPEDLRTTFEHETFDEIRDFADGFAKKEPGKLLRWRNTDVDVDFYAARWGKPLPNDGGQQLPKASEKSKTRSPASHELKRDQQRRLRREQKREALKQALSMGDIRLSGVAAHNLASLEELRRTTGGER